MSELVALKNPFVGPHPLTRTDPLYGRTREVAELFQLLDTQRIVLLQAPSGAGKTSLVQAGLLERLEAYDYHVLPIAQLHYLPDAAAMNGGGFNPYVYSLLLTLEEKQEDRAAFVYTKATEMPSILSYLQERVAAFEEWTAVALIIDQFEEILKNPVDVRQKEEFFWQLGCALRDLDIWTLLVIRDDFLGAVMDERYVRQIPTRLINSYHLTLLDRQAASEAISCTAAGCDKAGRPLPGAVDDPQRRIFDPEAVEQLVEDLCQVKVQMLGGAMEEKVGHFVEPVHLQVVCRKLWDKLPPEERRITVDLLGEFGDVDEALQQFYADEIEKVARKSQVEERKIRNWITNELVSASAVRLPLLEEERQTKGLDNQVIGMLVDAHLLRKETRAGRHFYELAHDRLVRPILQDNEDWARDNLSMLQKRAEEWRAGSKIRYLLLRDEDYLSAKRWADRNKGVMSDLDREFLAASAAVYEREEKQRLLQEQKLILAQKLARTRGIAIALGTMAALLIIVTGTIIFWTRLRSAEEQTVAVEGVAYDALNLAESKAVTAQAQANEAAFVQGTISAVQGTAVAGQETRFALEANVTKVLKTITVEAGAATATAEAGGRSVDATIASAKATVSDAYNAATLSAAQAESMIAAARARTGLAQIAVAAANSPENERKATVEAMKAISAQSWATSSAESAQATIRAAEVMATFAPPPAYAHIPAGAFMWVKSEPGSPEDVGDLTGPQRLRIWGNHGLWVKVQLPEGGHGWLNGTQLSFEGNRDLVHPALANQFVSGRSDLDFVYGVVSEPDQALAGLSACYPEAIADGTGVTVLERRIIEGSPCLRVLFVEDHSVVKKLIPAAFVIERN